MKLDNNHIVEIVVPHFTTNICVTRHIPARQTDLPDLPDISGHAVQNLRVAFRKRRSSQTKISSRYKQIKDDLHNGQIK